MAASRNIIVLRIALVILLFLGTTSTESHHHNKHSHSHSSSQSNFLSRLLSQSPLVLMVNSKMLSNKPDVDEQSAEMLRGGDDDVMAEAPAANEAYMLYNALRSTQETEKLDELSYDKLEGAKQVLREALVARCGQRNACVQKCVKKKKPQGCEANCKKVFDELDACSPQPKETKCKKKNDSCGKGRTMPPYWLRSLLGM